MVGAADREVEQRHADAEVDPRGRSAGGGGLERAAERRLHLIDGDRQAERDEQLDEDFGELAEIEVVASPTIHIRRDRQRIGETVRQRLPVEHGAREAGPRRGRRNVLIVDDADRLEAHEQAWDFVAQVFGQQVFEQPATDLGQELGRIDARRRLRQRIDRLVDDADLLDRRDN